MLLKTLLLLLGLHLILPLTQGHLSYDHNFLPNRVALLEGYYCTMLSLIEVQDHVLISIPWQAVI